jgi:hypothetical protein
LEDRDSSYYHRPWPQGGDLDLGNLDLTLDLDLNFGDLALDLDLGDSNTHFLQEYFFCQLKEAVMVELVSSMV